MTEGLTKTEIDIIVRGHIYLFVSAVIDELGERGFRSHDPHNITVKKSTLLDALIKVRQKYP